MSRRGVIVGGMVAATLLAVGALMVRLTAGDSSHDTSSPETSVVATPVAAADPDTDGSRSGSAPVVGPPVRPVGPTAEQAGVPVGFAPTEEGAVGAALAYASASQRWLYFDDAEITAAVAVLATPAAVEGLTAEVVSEIALARDQLAASSGRVWWLVRPMATRVEFFTATVARVSVWTVTVLSATGVAVPQAEWLTVTVDLKWLDDDWRVDGVRSTPGPTPILSPKDEPWTADRFDEGLDGFTRIDSEADRS
jgi:hypothetical protein